MDRDVGMLSACIGVASKQRIYPIHKPIYIPSYTESRDLNICLRYEKIFSAFSNLQKKTQIMTAGCLDPAV